MTARTWLPAGTLWIGVIASLGLRPNRGMVLRNPLSVVVADTIGAYVGTDVPLSRAELAVAGPSTYLFRVYRIPGDTAPGHTYTVYVGYYEEQVEGQTIHSPKNCLPGAGWEPLTASTATLATPPGRVPVNRYLLQFRDTRALVLYWYQGRGRVAANEYLVKWQLLRDSALKRRSDDAVVRVMVPVVDGDEDAAFALASRVAAGLMADLGRALPP